MKTAPFLIVVLCILLSCETSEPLISDSEIESLSVEGLTWSQIRQDDNQNLYVDSVIVSYSEIIGYDSSSYTYLLENSAGERIRAVLFPTSGVRFGIAIDSVLISTVYFVPGYSSMAINDVICVEPYSYSNKYRFYLGYHGGDHFNGEDNRNDPQIIERLSADNKLIEID